MKKFLVALGCVTNNKRLDFGGDAAIQEFVENFIYLFFYQRGTEAIVRNWLIIQQIVVEL